MAERVHISKSNGIRATWNVRHLRAFICDETGDLYSVEKNIMYYYDDFESESFSAVS